MLALDFPSTLGDSRRDSKCTVRNSRDTQLIGTRPLWYDSDVIRWGQRLSALIFLLVVFIISGSGFGLVDAVE